MSKLIVAAILAVTSAAAGAQVADPVRLRRTVDGYPFELLVEAGYEHRVTLTVREPKIGHRVQLVSPSLEVPGHPGEIYALEPVESPEGFAYQARVRMPLKRPYRIVVHATPQGTSRALMAQFEYRHRR